MYVKEIVLDGFKSYATRTQINGFDPMFNAITGLNGSGKSNILDSICFVLGISNLSHLRVEQLQNLVYNNGSTGITKATVSITFDNSDKNQCPPGYESFPEIVITRQIVVGGKNKYLINGINSPNKRVQDLFCSVQLNVNNPNFLIMQGRITKVLNMKPLEILAMIEVAAGTHMFETKRQEAMKAIEKKDAKLDNLVKILEDDISPKLRKLKEERKQYLEYQQLEREMEYTHRLWVIWQLMTLKRDRQSSDTNLKQLKDDIANKTKIIEDNENEIAVIEEKIKEINQNIDQEQGGILNELEEELKAKEKIENKVSISYKHAKENIKSEEKNLKQLQKSLQDDEKTLLAKESELAKMKETFSKLKEAQETDAKALQLAERQFEAASSGELVNEAGEVATAQAQLMAYQQEASEAATLVQQTEMDLKFAEKQLKSKTHELAGTSFDLKADKKQLAELDVAIKKKEKEIATLNFNEERDNLLKTRRTELSQQVRSLRNQVEHFENRHPRAAFRYKDPAPNFNRRRVKGLVCKLFKVKDVKFCTAMETSAASRLYNVIVDTSESSKLLLQKGNLQMRTTFIPLNKIQSSVISQKVIRAAEDLVGSDNVQSALSLISYDNELKTGMEYVFGNVLICKNLSVATKVAFNQQIMTRCVTLDGDVVDPAGVLSGGAAGEAGTLLKELHSLKDTIKNLSQYEEELINIEREMQTAADRAEQYYQLKQQLDLAKHDYNLLQEQLQQTDHYRKRAEIDNLKTSIDEMKTRIKDAKEKEKNCKNKVDEIQNQIADSEGYLKRQLTEAQNNVEKLKKKSEQSKKEWAKRENEYETINLELGELRKALETGKTEIETLQKQIENLKENCSKTEEELNVIKEETAELKEKIKLEKSAIHSKTTEIKQMVKKKKELNEQSQEMKLDIQKMNLELGNRESEFQQWEAKEQHIIDNNDWLETDTHYTSEFQKLSAKEQKEMGSRYKQLKDRHHTLSRQVNTRALSLLETEEENFQRISKRQRIIKADKQTILSSIEDLNKKKEKAIHSAWEKVNENFSSIFSTLLPDADCKLQPKNEQSVLHGLEIQVSLGGKWQDLSQLSGGQRSLTALSLILAMLLFKPAPVYILDEIDSALDLSQTQNMGDMLRKHFQHSQFIIVSLKDGMFDNANVLFKTQFVDGISSVTRTVCRK